MSVCISDGDWNDNWQWCTEGPLYHCRYFTRSLLVPLSLVFLVHQDSMQWYCLVGYHHLQYLLLASKLVFGDLSSVDNPLF